MMHLAPLSHPTLDLFLLGFIVCASLAALLFFLRFWRSTKDPLFLSFAVFFAVQCATHTLVLSMPHPNEGAPWIYALRLLSVLCILAAILWKNRRHA